MSHRIRIAVALVAATAVLFVGSPAHADSDWVLEPDRRPCVTVAEYNRIAPGRHKDALEGLWDTEGITFYRDDRFMVKRYRNCRALDDPTAALSVAYVKARGIWRVSGFILYDYCVEPTGETGALAPCDMSVLNRWERRYLHLPVRIEQMLS